MADQDQDKSQKTEDATPKRLEEALKKGQVAKSQEINHFFMLVAVTFVILFFSNSFLKNIGEIIIPFLESPHNIASDPGNLLRVSKEVGIKLVAVISIPIVFFVLAAILGNFIQHKPVFTSEQIKPKLNKISLIAGAKRLFSPRSLVEFSKSLAKLFIIGGVIILVVLPERKILSQMMTVESSELFNIIKFSTLKIFLSVVIIMFFLAIADFSFQKYEHLKNLKMSKQDIKDENKQSEGDPQVKARIRSLRAERSRQRMISSVPNADVIITNPTHYAVALEYEGSSMEAPKLLAKGKNKIAEKIKEIANENNIPIVENPPLARGIFSTVEIGQEVPPEHYKAVAEVIGYVMKVKGESARRKFQSKKNN